jgi:hypothetical protein
MTGAINQSARRRGSLLLFRLSLGKIAVGARMPLHLDMGAALIVLMGQWQ